MNQALVELFSKFYASNPSGWTTPPDYFKRHDMDDHAMQYLLK
jgi:hypothetical protein